MPRKRFVLIIEGDAEYSSGHMLPVVVRRLVWLRPRRALPMRSTPAMQPDARYFVGAWIDDAAFEPTILDGLGSDRAHAERIVALYNRLERDVWAPAREENSQ